MTDHDERLALHQAKVEAIARTLRAHGQNGGRYFSLRKATISHTVPNSSSSRHADDKLSIVALNDLVTIDAQARTCTAEAGLPFVSLVRATLAQGLAPLIVPELETITVGGAVAGCSVESASFRYGGFHDTCLEYEVITGGGEIVRCSREARPELFEMVHGSYGTLGILSLLTFKLAPASPYVRIAYTSYSSFDSLLAQMRAHYERGGIDFMDAIVHAPNRSVLCLGTYVDEVPQVSRYKRKPYYRSTLDHAVDYLRTEDYFFRFDADCHWMARRYGLENPALRLLFGPWLLGSTNMLRWAQRVPFLAGPPERPDVVADVFIPFANAGRFFDWYSRTFDFFPLWVVPYRMQRRYPWINPELMRGLDDELFIDFAIYGFRQRGTRNYYRAIEEKVHDLGGVKTLITHNYYSEEEFWRTFNRPHYEEIKRAVDPHNLFRDLYGKTHARS